MKALLTFLLVFIPAAAFASAQTGSFKCPQIDVTGPEGIVSPGQPIVFRAKLANVEVSDRVAFSWEVTLGTITAGQGTTEITVDTTGLTNSNITATLRIKGFATDCRNSFSSVAQVGSGIGCGGPLDEWNWSTLKLNDQMARIDNLLIATAEREARVAFILVEVATPKTLDSARKRFSQLLKAQLRYRPGLELDKLILGFSLGTQNSARAWTIPPGVDYPMCEKGCESMSARQLTTITHKR